MRAFAHPDLNLKFADEYSQQIMKRFALAQDPSSSEDLLFELAHDNYSGIRCYVAMNPSTPLYLVKRLTADEDAGVRACAFKSGRFDRWICDLYWDNPQNKRTEPAWNQSTSEETLRSLVFSSNLDDRLGVASNNNSPVDTLEKLAGDEHHSVRFQVARNKKTPEHVLAILKRDTDHHVRRMASFDPYSLPEDPFAW